MGRQIRMIHGQTFSSEEMLRFKHNIRSSCLESFALLVSEYLPLHKTTSQWQVQCTVFLERLAANKLLDRPTLDIAVNLWGDSAVQEYLVDIDPQKVLIPVRKTGFPRNSENGEHKKLRFYLDDPAYHFLPSLDRIMSEGYCPTTGDILSLRSPTTGNNVH